MSTAFDLTVGYNGWLAAGDTRLDAAVAITSETDGNSTAEVAEIIVIDRSGSMYGDKFTEAKRAAKAAVDVLRDGAYFSVVAGATEAVPQYPLDGTLAQADDRTRAGARAAIDAMNGGSSTSIGAWLRCAADILATRPAAIGQVLLLTDGQVTQNTFGYHADLDYCHGKFRCDSVGIGLDWDPDELAQLAERFQGTFKFCEDLAALPEYFTQISGNAMSKAAADVELHVVVPEETELESLSQMVPVKQDLAGHRRPLDDDEEGWAFPLAAWGTETREYLLRFDFPPTGLGMRLQVLIEVWRGDELVAEKRVIVRWTEERSQFLAIDPQVAALLGQGEVSAEIDSAVRAIDAGDFDTATQAAQRAYRLAEEGGFDGLMHTLGRLAVYDPDTKSVRIRQKVSDGDLKSAMTGSYEMEGSRTVLGRKEEPS
ncbi:vWA domain-containing protein [Glycomyces harbinensis]|uniref:von Willebrand factor type A domain-containing protein n=1 Tax=Glycomyces harbinensis TaxID=58114 RepID=A0A1G6R5L1_9ACTN|nr:vWA domain-containing protein [Glycomyces harbinensis]SDC99375.1 von Willebrand factor type A domain-containing protein [Glycomyces harbinensis]